ncbi:hypothetical protein R6Q57_024468 [Mikania cordata]
MLTTSTFRDNITSSTCRILLLINQSPLAPSPLHETMPSNPKRIPISSRFRFQNMEAVAVSVSLHCGLVSVQAVVSKSGI